MGKQANITSFTAISLLFILGVVAGCVLSANITGDAETEMALTISQAIPLLSQRGDILWIVVNTLIYPIGIFILGLTFFGVLVIPVAIAAKGFFLSFTVASLVRVFGYSGLLTAAGAIGLQCILTVPCLFILASQGVLTSLNVLSLTFGKGKRIGTSINRSYFVKFAVCISFFFVSTLFEVYISPHIMSFISR